MQEGERTAYLICNWTLFIPEIARITEAGKNAEWVACELGIAEGTVKVHVRHVLKKLQLRSRVEAAVWADRWRRQLRP